jgi:phage protein D
MTVHVAPIAEIKCDGDPLPAQAASSLTEVTVESRLDLPGRFALTLADTSLAMIARDDGLLHEGLRVEIALGYEKKLKCLITGEISTVSAEMSPQGRFARVAGYDMLHRLARGTNYRHYIQGDEAMSDSAIAHTIINDAGLKPVVDDTHARSIPRVQDNRSDLDFLVMLAGLNGYYLYSEAERVCFSAQPPSRGELSLAWGNNLISFYPHLCLNGLVGTLEVRGRDASLGENYAETLERPREDLLFLSPAGRDMLKRGSGGRSALNLHDAMISSAQDAKAYLAGAMRERQAIVAASGSCTGDPELMPGTVLKISEVGRFSGDYLVLRAVHRFGGKGYTTSFDLRLLP